MVPSATFRATLTAATVAVVALLGAGPAAAKTLWVDPSGGRDAGPGTPAKPLATLTEAWNRLPAVPRKPARIELRAGDYRGRTPVYWERQPGRNGSPILIRSADGRGRARLPAVNLFGVSNLEFRGVSFSDGGDVIHCERCNGFTLRGVTATGRDAQETVKVNQSRRVRIFGSRIGGAGDNAIDFVAVNRGRIRGNVVYGAGDWCAYAKGGSVDIRVTGNLFTRCGTGGFTAGQGTGFQFMTRPWITYEATGVVIRGNTVTETEGAAFAVQGGFNVLVANNVARRVGRRSHVLEALYGSRSCDGRPGDPLRWKCDRNLSERGWGTTGVSDGTNDVRIPNRHVYFVSNVVYNPAPYRSRWQQLEVPGPVGIQPGTNVPAGASAASDLRFLGNVVWNGPHNMALGADGCRPSNRTCNAGQLRRQNMFNRRRPALRKRGRLLLKSGWTRAWHPYRIPSARWSDLPAGSRPWTTWPK